MTLKTYAHAIEELEGAERVPAEIAIREARNRRREAWKRLQRRPA